MQITLAYPSNTLSNNDEHEFEKRSGMKNKKTKLLGCLGTIILTMAFMAGGENKQLNILSNVIKCVKIYSKE